METHHNALINFMKDKDIKTMAEVGAAMSKMTELILNIYKHCITQYWATDIWGWNEANKIYINVSKTEWDIRYFHACQLMCCYPQLRVIKGSALEIFEIFPESFFNLVYIDADHHYDFMASTIKNWRPLIKTDGFLLGKIPRKKPEELLRAVSDCIKETDVIIDQDGQLWTHRVQ